LAYEQSNSIAPPISDVFAMLWLRVTLTACTGGRLPPALGTTVHGALGRALKLAACAFPNPATLPCTGCRLLAHCPYPRLFEPQYAVSSGSVPPPALLVAPGTPLATTIVPGTLVRLELGLIGRAVAALPLLLAALARMVETGLGPQRTQFAIDRVDALNAGGEPGYDVQVGGTIAGQMPRSLTAASWRDLATRQAGAMNNVRLQVRTRLRLQREGLTNADPPSFVDLVRALVRRSDILARVYCAECDPFPDPRHWLQAAEDVSLASARLHWQEHKRRSTSTGHTMPLDGFVGSLRYTAPAAQLAPFLPLLYLGEAIGVGRGCSFGNGRYRMVADPR